MRAGGLAYWGETLIFFFSHAFEGAKMGLEKLAFAGIVFIFIGILLIVVSSLTSPDVKTGGVLLLGPIPIIFGNDRRLIYVSLAFAAFIIVVWLLARRIR